MRGPPSQVPRVCVGPATSPQYQGRVNISWDPPPCHLQNGANVTDRNYIIQYTRLLTGVPTNISSTDSQVGCRQEPGGPNSCMAATSLFVSDETYSFQVAAQNVFGVGSFSAPVLTTYNYSSQGS